MSTGGPPPGPLLHIKLNRAPRIGAPGRAAALVRSTRGRGSTARGRCSSMGRNVPEGVVPQEGFEPPTPSLRNSGDK